MLDRILDVFRGKAVTIPPMDGALKPNTALDDADVVVAARAPDNIAITATGLIYTSGAEIREVESKKILATHAADIASLAVNDDGHLAVGLDNGKVLVSGTAVGDFNCPTAMRFDGNSLLVCNGSAKNSPSEWVRDLMQGNTSGTLWRVDLATQKCTQLASGLAFPHGITIDQTKNRIVISESWKHRLISVPANGGQASAVLSRLPGYPSRLTSTADGYLLCLFAPLNRLVEFVLQEDDYRHDMMQEIDSRFWIAPTLAPSSSFLEPLQNGGVRSMGVHKPWSPSRSYGLLVELDAEFQPIRSYHSRANGRFHGITSAASFQDHIVATSKGGNHIIRLQADGSDT